MPGQRFTRREGTDWLTDYITKAMCNGRMGTREAEKWFPGQVRGNAPEPAARRLPGAARTRRGAQGVDHGRFRPAARPVHAPGHAADTPPTRRQRLKSKIEMWRNLAARRAYRIVAGYWPDNGEDDW